MKHCSTCTCENHKRLVPPDPDLRRCGSGIDQFVDCERPEGHEGACWNSCWGWEDPDSGEGSLPVDVNPLHTDLDCNQPSPGFLP